MNIYTVHQWVLLFYLYCFMGWIWESCYVSLKNHKWVNRGFLKGPLLPIYGSGAIVVLISTLVVQKNLVLVFIIGMIAATILEYITGALMEKLFHVRYWDYTTEPFNINGHVCLLCSLAWGVFSVLLVRFVNPPIEYLINNIPDEILEISAYIITVFITIDAVQSFNEAMDLKNLLIRFTERNDTIINIKKRIEILEAFVNEDVKSMQEKLVEKVAIKQEKSAAKKNTRKQAIEAIIRRNLALKEEATKGVVEKVSRYVDKFDELSAKAIDEPSKIKAEFLEYLSKLKVHELKINNTENKVYMNSINILRRNPNARAKKYEEAMREVKNLDKNLSDK
ncbi:putative ABC transporter permease [uncultured Clostridium sp.]|uniref:putative ABC transporter permease n=1 Tax=uncultured Clostridium sp. TaxID=59620 RepID=UPI0025D3DC06|nr:putative ABC transporter permease [uncultured Clostridium sp.]